jgi:hypothetical protein
MNPWAERRMIQTSAHGFIRGEKIDPQPTDKSVGNKLISNIIV